MSQIFHENYAQIGRLYSKLKIEGTVYLAFRDLPYLLERYLPKLTQKQLKILDFGCGTGLSTRYLKLILNQLNEVQAGVEGVDVSEEVIMLARQEDPSGIYKKVEKGHIPAPHSYYDLIYSSFVLFELASKEEMVDTLQEIKRVMRKGAHFIATTGSIEQYNPKNKWVSLNGDFLENSYLQSGDLARLELTLKGGRLTFHNYYWKDEDYKEAFNQAGLHLQQVLYPLANHQEEQKLGWKWKDETKVSPYYTYVLEKVEE